MRLFIALIFLLEIAAVSASELQLEDGRLVSGALVIYSDHGAKVINHGARPDEFYPWSEISEVGLGEHERALRTKFLEKAEQNPPVAATTTSPTHSTADTSDRDPNSDARKVDLDGIFSGSDSPEPSAPETSRAKGKVGTLQDLKEAMPERGRAESTRPAPEMVSLDSIKANLGSLSEISQLGSGKNFGILVAGTYLLISLILFVVNFLSKKKLSWSEKPELIGKAVKTAFWLTVVPVAATSAVLVFFADRAGAEAQPLWLAASVTGGAFLLAFGVRKKSRFCSFILLSAAVAVTTFHFLNLHMSDVSLMRAGVILLFCVITFALIDAFFATIHYHAKKKEPKMKNPLPETDFAEASA